MIFFCPVHSSSDGWGWPGTGSLWKHTESLSQWLLNGSGVNLYYCVTCQTALFDFFDGMITKLTWTSNIWTWNKFSPLTSSQTAANVITHAVVFSQRQTSQHQHQRQTLDNNKRHRALLHSNAKHHKFHNVWSYLLVVLSISSWSSIFTFCLLLRLRLMLWRLSWRTENSECCGICDVFWADTPPTPTSECYRLGNYQALTLLYWKKLRVFCPPGGIIYDHDK